LVFGASALTSTVGVVVAAMLDVNAVASNNANNLFMIFSL
jgi:hypothetical protein